MVNDTAMNRSSWLDLKRILLGLCLLAAQPAFAGALAQYEWQNRPLLVFAPMAQDQRLEETRQLLAQTRCQLDGREMIIGIFVMQGQSYLEDSEISSQLAADIRRDYGVSGDQFAVLLLGKDGGVKYRSPEVPNLAEIFALIDGMPMRQVEMAENPVDCAGQSGDRYD